MERRFFLYRGFYLACFLSIVFCLVLFWVEGINYSTILLSLLTLNLNVAFILLITFIIIIIPVNINKKVFLFSFMSILFSFIYFFNFSLFLTRGEGLRLQLVLFTYRFVPFLFFVSVLIGIFLILLFATFISSKLIQNKIEKIDSHLEKSSHVVRKVSRHIGKAGEKTEGRIKDFEKLPNGKFWTTMLIIVFLILLLAIIFIYAPLLLINASNPNPFLVRWGSSFYTFEKNPNLEARDLGETVLDFQINNSKQNVVFIMMDAVPYYKLNYYGYNRTTSPNIDKLAKESLVFWNAFSTASHSDYSQTAFLSSRHTLINNVQNFFDDYPRKFAWDVFKDEGYLTAHVSSQNDEWAYINYYFNTDNLDFYHDSMADSEYDYGMGKARKDFDDRTANYAIDWLKNNVSDEPFFLYLNFQSAHSPHFRIPEGNSYYDDEWIPFLTMDFQDYVLVVNRYDNALLFIDKQIQRIIDVIEKKGEMNNTIIIITSDHGEDLEGQHDQYGHGMSIYDEEIHIPFIMYIPGIGHKDIYDNVAQIDLFPTIFDLLGYSIPEEFQGKVMRKNSLIISYIQSYRYYMGLIDNDMKIILDMHDEEIELFNLTEDPQELNNLVGSVNHSVYFNELMEWYLCQLDYYDKELWTKGELAPKC